MMIISLPVNGTQKWLIFLLISTTMPVSKYGQKVNGSYSFALCHFSSWEFRNSRKSRFSTSTNLETSQVKICYLMKRKFLVSTAKMDLKNSSHGLSAGRHYHYSLQFLVNNLKSYHLALISIVKDQKLLCLGSYSAKHFIGG